MARPDRALVLGLVVSVTLGAQARALAASRPSPETQARVYACRRHRLARIERGPLPASPSAKPAAPGAVATRPVAIYAVAPRQSGPQFITGTVTAEATIDEEGCVEALRVLASSNARVEQAALDAWRRWVFQPATLEGKPVESTYVVTIGFEREHAARPAEKDPPFTAYVTDREAKFVLPVDHQGKWDWYRESTPDQAMEYEWQVSVRNGADAYGFGFYLFKPEAAPPQSGDDLTALLHVGQASLFRNGEKDSKLIEGAGVTGESAGDRVVLRVEGKENVRRLFSSHPETVTFDVKTPGEAETKREVKVRYRP